MNDPEPLLTPSGCDLCYPHYNPRVPGSRYCSDHQPDRQPPPPAPADDLDECDRCHQQRPGPWHWWAGDDCGRGAALYPNVCATCVAEMEAHRAR
jgi:hypothetical protein